MTLTKYRNCVGAKLDYEMFPVMKKSTKGMVYEEAQNIGIHPRQYYSVLDIRVIEVPVKGQLQQVSLVRLLDPWAGSVDKLPK